MATERLNAVCNELLLTKSVNEIPQVTTDETTLYTYVVGVIVGAEVGEMLGALLGE